MFIPGDHLSFPQNKTRESQSQLEKLFSKCASSMVCNSAIVYIYTKSPVQIQDHFNYLWELANSFRQLRHDISFKIIRGHECQGTKKNQAETREAPKTQEAHKDANHSNPAAEMPLMTVYF